MADAPLLDPGASADPLVGGVDDLLQIVIGEHVGGHALAPSGYLRGLHRNSWVTPSNDRRHDAGDVVETGDDMHRRPLGTLRRAMPAVTSPGPMWTNVSIPTVDMSARHSANRTVETTCRCIVAVRRRPHGAGPWCWTTPGTPAPRWTTESRAAPTSADAVHEGRVKGTCDLEWDRPSSPRDRRSWRPPNRCRPHDPATTT